MYANDAALNTLIFSTKIQKFHGVAGWGLSNDALALVSPQP